MTGGALPWLGRPGLAGGIDKDGSRAAELLALGFGSVEFGTVAADGSAAALAARLAALPARAPGSTAIGIGIGLPAGTAEAGLPAAWLAGLGQTWRVADYLSFNLSARACRPLLAARHLPLLGRALAAVAAARRRLPVPLPLALKLPLGNGDEPLPVVADMAAGAGFDLLTAVLPEAGDGPGRLAALARRLAGGPALVAVGGIRCAADVAAARAAGARGVQVHRLFAEQGAACLGLLAGEKPGRSAAASARDGGAAGPAAGSAAVPGKGGGAFVSIESSGRPSSRPGTRIHRWSPRFCQAFNGEAREVEIAAIDPDFR